MEPMQSLKRTYNLLVILIHKFCGVPKTPLMSNYSHMSYSLTSLKGVIKGSSIGVLKVVLGVAIIAHMMNQAT